MNTKTEKPEFFWHKKPKKIDLEKSQNRKTAKPKIPVPPLNWLEQQ